MKLQTPFTPMVKTFIASSLFFEPCTKASRRATRYARAGALVLLMMPAARAAEIQGTVFDPGRNPIAGAQVAAFNQTGVIITQITDDRGHFDFNVSPLFE